MKNMRKGNGKRGSDPQNPRGKVRYLELQTDTDLHGFRRKFS